MLKVNNLIGFGGNSSGNKLLSYRNLYTLGANTTFNFTSCDLGDPAPGRVIIIGAAHGYRSRTVSSATIAGVSATKIDEQLSTAGSSEMTATLLAAVVPTGATGTISVTLNNSNDGMVLTVWAAYGLNSVDPIDKDKSSGNATLTLVTAPGGFVVGVNSRASDSTYTWTNLDNLFNQVFGGSLYASSGNIVTTGTSLSVTGSSSSTKTPFIVASY